MLPLVIKHSKGSAHMGRIVVTAYISVDGVVEAPSGTEHFERVGWTDAYPIVAARKATRSSSTRR
jgi:hypothetical protein